MRRLVKPLSFLALTALLAPAAAHSAEAFTLPNGLSIVVVPRPDVTTVEVGWAMAAGSADERPGETGQARIVALLLDDGTRTIGTKDAARERPLMVEADGLYARRPWADDKAAIDARLDEIKRELATIQDLGAFRGAYQTAGVKPPRATVGEDSTIFTASLPPDRLELWFRLEADRLRAPVFRRIASAIADATAEWQADRALNLAADAERQFRLAAWDGHPYAWPSSGLSIDYTRMTRYLLETFHKNHYGPDKMTIVVVGPVTTSSVRALAEKYFGPVPRPVRRPSRPVPALEPRERGLQQTVETVPRLLVEYRTPGAADPDIDALRLLARLLDGPQGRLQRAIGEAGLSAVARARMEPRRQLGSLRLEVSARTSGPDPESFLAPLDREIERLRTEPVPEAEIATARASLEADLQTEIAESARLARLLLEDAGRGGLPERALGLAERLARITPADLQRVAAARLDRGVRTVGLLKPAS